MKKTLLILTIVAAVSLLTGCSVVMAAHQSGVDVTTLSSCKTRYCLINNGAVPIQSTQNKSGVLTEEVFQAQIPTGSVARAAMHGVLDVATFGIWEVAGTPIEAVKGRKQTYAIKVFYEADGSTIKQMQLMQ